MLKVFHQHINIGEDIVIIDVSVTHTRLLSNLRADHPQRRVFSCNACSLQVKSQRWRTHHLISHSRKAHATWKLHSAVFYRRAVSDKRSLPVQGFFYLSAPVTFTWWPSYMNLIHILWGCTGFENMNFLRHVFRKLSSDRDTYRHDWNDIYHATWQVVNNLISTSTRFTN